MATQFVDGWTIVQVLGEGAFGEVKLLINDETKDALAVKIIDTKLHPDVKLSVRKEIAVHKVLTHPNIIKYFGHRTEETYEYIFLEYASGGELFDKIEPDVGMKLLDAQKYFKQLLSAVTYLHDIGVSHRDIKPENILLADNDDIKLSDFGMATIFRKKGVERLLDKKCGTMPYVAPEVLLRPYHASPADIWSCGVVLVAMLAGELPWDSPTSDCKEFVCWRNNMVTTSPWNKLDNNVLNLLRKILVPLPEKRLTSLQILKHRWCQMNVYDGNVTPTRVTPASKRLYSGTDLSPPGNMLLLTSEDDSARLCQTQPLPRLHQSPDHQHQHNMHEYVCDDVRDNRAAMYCFSQPAALDDLLLSSQLHSSTQASQFSYQKLVRRMTRFFVSSSMDETLENLEHVLDAIGCTWKTGPPGVVTATTIDKRKMPLVFKTSLVEMDSKVLLDFRLSRGDGLEFKRKFLQVKEKLKQFVMKGPVTWSLAVATNTVP